MKQLFACVVLLAIAGIAVFLYQNTMNRPNAVVPQPVACTLEAKVCPDGTSVGRQGPNCEFAACALPNVEIKDAGVAFVIPNGYAPDENAYGADPSLIAAFAKPSVSGNPTHSISIRTYPIAAGETANDVILAQTRYQPADMQAEDFSRFTPAIVNGRTFQATVIERFEGHVTSRYFLARARDVLVFEIAERDVLNWTDPNLVIEELPEHRVLLQLLATLQSAT